MVLYRISSPSLVSEIFVTKGTCVSGFPTFMLGQPITSIKAYCQKKGWIIECIDLAEEVELN